MNEMQCNIYRTTGSIGAIDKTDLNTIEKNRFFKNISIEFLKIISPECK